ncbi:MAG: ABC transporter permease [Calditrichaeota bacterium]|nr:MAG: ABC transporter permease [Calditrichota bacterium]
MLELIQTAISQLLAHRLRSFLTTLGIIIGIGTVILVVSVLEGYRSSIERDLNVLGANTFQVQRYPNEGGFDAEERRRFRKPLKKELAEAIRERCPSVKFVGAEVWRFGQSVSYRGQKTRHNINVVGVTPEFSINNGYFVEEGRFITDRDVRSHARVAVLGMDVVDRLFPVEYPVGRVIRLQGQKFTVVGIFERQGSATFGESRDDLIAIPITAWEALYGRQHSVNLTVMARSPELFQQAQDEVVGVLRKERKVPPGEENDFYIFSNETLIKSFNSFAIVVQAVGAGIAIISLFVGGIGVMNIMLVSVTERTREIGIRKAVGARRRDIRRQFLFEAITLCLIGGVLGFLVGVGVAALFSLTADIPMTVPWWSVVAALSVTTVVGIFSGLYPAWKAARLAPVEALRYE